MMKVDRYNRPRWYLLLCLLGLLSWTGCFGNPDNGNALPDSIKTDKADSFKLPKIFIDARTASAAFLVLRKFDNGAAGDLIQADKLPLGRHDPLTIKLKKPYTLSVGKQKLQITVYLDDNKNGQYDDTDSIADGGSLQKVVEIELANDNLMLRADLLSSTKTDVDHEFPVGECFIPQHLAKGAFLVLFEDKGGKPGELVEAMPLKLNQNRKISMKLTPPRKLLSGKQTFHLAVHLDTNENGTYEPTDAVAQMAGKPVQQKIEVELTTDRYDNNGEFVDKLHTILPNTFVVGKFDLATDPKIRYYLVVRLIEDGKPGKTLGVNEWRFEGRLRDMTATLKHPLMREKQQIYMGIYENTTSKGWDESNWDQNANVAVRRDGSKIETTIDVTFESSVADPNAEYYAQTCATRSENDHKVTHKTNLKIDCRCTHNRIRKPTVTYCNADSLSSLTVGNGPRFKNLKGHMTSGDNFDERDEIIFGFTRGGVSTGGKHRYRFTILALNYKTNTRRFVSGEVQDPRNGEFVVGKGPLGERVTALRRGPDGKAYAYSKANGGWIFRVDVETGDREIFWKHGDPAYGQCSNGVRPKGHPDWKLGDSQPAPYQLGIEGRGMTVAPDGSIYLQTTSNGYPQPGYGIIRISKDAKTCKVIATSGAEIRNEYYGGVGKGYDIKGPIGSMTWHNGKLLAIVWGGDLLEIDPETGDRTRLAGSGLTGSSSLPPAWRIFVDPKTKLLMLTGILPPNNPNVIGVNLETGKAWTWLCLNHDPKNTYTSGCLRGPQATKYISYMPGYRLPDGNYLGGISSFGFNLYELSTGNSYIYNY